MCLHWSYLSPEMQPYLCRACTQREPEVKIHLRRYCFILVCRSQFLPPSSLGVSMGRAFLKAKRLPVFAGDEPTSSPCSLLPD